MVRTTTVLGFAIGACLAAEAVMAGAVLVEAVCRVLAGEERDT